MAQPAASGGAAAAAAAAAAVLLGRTAQHSGPALILQQLGSRSAAASCSSRGCSSLAAGPGPSSSAAAALLLRRWCAGGAGGAALRRGFSSSSTAAGAAGAGASGAAGAAASAAGHRAAASSGGALRRLRALLRDYKQLSKLRLSALVALTASAGFAAGSGEELDWARLGWTSLGTLGAAACANALNQLYEVGNDARMARTALRPLPGGRMGRAHAAAFALAAGAAGLWLLLDEGKAGSPAAAALGALNVLLYAGCYTPLKQLSPVNTWVGALVGAVPPLMGWAAARGADADPALGGLEPGAWVLAAALFCWQMPHFMALMWMCRDDYARGGFRMLTRVDPTGRRTANVALRHSLALVPLGAAAAALGVASPWFAAEAAALGAAMAASAAAFRAAPSAASARLMFRRSLLYLPLLLAALAVHRRPASSSTTLTWADVGAAAERAAQRARVPLLPEQLQPGAVWGALAGLADGVHWPEMRPPAERYAMFWSVRCPSRVYGDSVDGDDDDDDDAAAAAAAADGEGNGEAEAASCKAAAQPRR